MTATMEDLDLHALFSDAIKCQCIADNGERCMNDAEWIREFRPCGHHFLTCTQCKLDLEEAYSWSIPMRRLACGQCGGLPGSARWRRL